MDNAVGEEVMEEREEVGELAKSGHTNEVDTDGLPAGDKKRSKFSHAPTLTYTIQASM